MRPAADDAETTPSPSRRTLGRSGLQVSPICLGGNVFGWTVDRKTTFGLLDAWLDAGMNFVDTADSYSRWVPGNCGGESEEMIGDWLAESGKRHRVVLATKVGSDMGAGKIDLSAPYIERAVDASLRRLRTDHIDLYQSHWDDPETPLVETLEAYSRLMQAGKIRAIGASNLTPGRLAEAVQVSGDNGLSCYASLQAHYNLCERGLYEGELEDVCIQANINVLPYYSLASGFLTGKYRNQSDAAISKRGAAATRYLNGQGTRILSALDTAATEHSATASQVALAWLATRPGVASPIASATSIEQLEELVRSTRLTLSPETLEKLDRASTPIDRQENAA